MSQDGSSVRWFFPLACSAKWDTSALLRLQSKKWWKSEWQIAFRYRACLSSYWGTLLICGGRTNCFIAAGDRVCDAHFPARAKEAPLSRVSPGKTKTENLAAARLKLDQLQNDFTSYKQMPTLGKWTILLCGQCWNTAEAVISQASTLRLPSWLSLATWTCEKKSRGVVAERSCYQTSSSALLCYITFAGELFLILWLFVQVPWVVSIEEKLGCCGQHHSRSQCRRTAHAV